MKRKSSPSKDALDPATRTRAKALGPQTSGNRDLKATISSLNEFGDGVIHGHRQFIKVARTVPGDQVRVRVPVDDKRYLYGKLLTIEKPSPFRVDPHCAAFVAGCGGCQWLGLDYPEQLRWKTRILREVLGQRVSPSIRVDEIIAMDSPFGYRNKLSLRALAGRFAFMQEFDDTTIAPNDCRVQTAPNQLLWNWLKTCPVPPDLLQLHARSSEDGKVGIHLFVQRHGKAADDFARQIMRACDFVSGVGAADRKTYRVLAGSDWIEHSTHGLAFRIPLNGFFQTNYHQADVLLDVALAQLALKPRDRVLDLYCGAGFFTLPLAQTAAQIFGVENNEASTIAAQNNAARNGIANASFRAADVETALAELEAGDWDAILLDPPRSGCAPGVIQQIERLACPRIVYVSCLPESLARDLKLFLRAGYELLSCQPVDMFPHTSHIETVVSLRRR